MHKNLTNLTIIEKQINDKIEGTLSDSKKINILYIQKVMYQLNSLLKSIKKSSKSTRLNL